MILNKSMYKGWHKRKTKATTSYLLTDDIFKGFVLFISWVDYVNKMFDRTAISKRQENKGV